VAVTASAQSGSVNGRIANSQGSAVGDAEVSLRPLPSATTMRATPGMPAMPGMAAPDRTARPNADGSFAFTQVAPGEYVLQVDAPGFERWSGPVTVTTQAQTVAVSLVPIDVPSFMATPDQLPRAVEGGTADTQALLARIRTLEQRISDLETSAVISEPETRVKRVDAYIDADGNSHDEPVPGATRTVTYQRERVYRRQSINEKLEEVFADYEARTIKVGVDAASVVQFTKRTRGTAETAPPTGNAYQLASADLFFAGGIAQYTSFFADIVGLSGSPPDAEVPTLTLLNAYTARLVRQNEINVREAWVRTELFSQRLAVSGGRLDLTNYFDQNAVANDETTQFISDVFANNPALGLSSNGAGFAAVFDPKIGVTFRFGVQQSNPEAVNLSDSIYSLAEVGYVARPPGLLEGNYRLWFRSDNSAERSRNAVGISLDQKVMPALTLFGRYGSAEADVKRDHFYSLGFQLQNGMVFNPFDSWGFGYSESRLASPDQVVKGYRERLVEGYYNFRLSEKLRLSFHLSHAFERPPFEPSYGVLVPAIRLQAGF
jgi:hypothetical protein